MAYIVYKCAIAMNYFVNNAFFKDQADWHHGTFASLTISITMTRVAVHATSCRDIAILVSYLPRDCEVPGSIPNEVAFIFMEDIICYLF